jgi:hypothetical protein
MHPKFTRNYGRLMFHAIPFFALLYGAYEF